LQFGGAVTQHMRQILQVISRSDAEPSYHISRCAFQVAIPTELVGRGQVILRPSKVRIAGDSRGALEVLQTILRLGLRSGVKFISAKEFI
jgi:hypothetical protein